jgi:arylsulfatase A-like enzyme
MRPLPPSADCDVIGGMHWFATLSAGLVVASFAAHAASRPTRPPNVVLIFADDLGYADLGCFGATKIKTPSIDRLAAEGIRFTDFYVAQAVCSASRCALLTGCYPNRVGITGALDHRSRVGLHPEEMTMAEVLQSRGYATAVVGKWHLGYQPDFLPVRHGFDEWFGLPYSNDMWPFHPEARAGSYPPLPLYDGDRIVDAQVDAEDQDTLTTRYTERAVRFMEQNRGRPFFLYLAHSMPHVPLHVSRRGRGHSAAGLYGDVIEEIDWSVGKVLEALQRLELDRETLVIFTSDNGPWISYGDHAGSAGPLREAKGTAWEGGVRVPFVARWPGQIPGGAVSREPAMTIDLLPTFAGLANASLPPRRIDGRDIWPLLAGAAGARSPHNALWFYFDKSLLAVRSGRWKLVLPHTYRTLGAQPPATGGKPVPYRQARADLELYDLESDPGEKKNLVDREPETVVRLQQWVEEARADLGDALTQRQPAQARAPAQIPTSP